MKKHKQKYLTLHLLLESNIINLINYIFVPFISDKINNFLTIRAIYLIDNVGLSEIGSI